MSDTPRTDHAEIYYREVVQDADAPMYLTSSDFARQLERALAAMTDERNEAQRRLKLYEPIHTFDNLTIEQWMDRAKKAEAALEAAAKDAERLDWLSKNYGYVMLSDPLRQMHDPTGTGNLRAAIDAARKP